MTKAGRFIVRRPWILIGVALAVAFAYWVAGTRSQTHELKAGFSTALNLAPGLDVRVDGIDAGKITEVHYEDGFTTVGLGIEDEEVWPLHRGTRATVRWGTTVGDGTRFIELDPGPESEPELGEGGVIPADQTVEAVEFDDIFNTFDKDTRDNVQRFAEAGAETFDGREDELQDGIRHTAPSLYAASGVFRDLVADDQQLEKLVGELSSTASTLAREDDDIRSLVSGLAATMDELGSHSVELQENIERFPRTLADTRTTLARLDVSVDNMEPLIREIEPGAEQLRVLAADARPALQELRATVPQAVSTVNTAERAAPQITDLLQRGQPFGRDVDPLLSRLAPMLECVRPYAPELAGFFTNWIAFTKDYGTGGHWARTQLFTSPGFSYSDYPLDENGGIQSDDFVAATGAAYAFPRPPGLGTGDPMFIEECGYGPESLDPSQDPEDEPPLTPEQGGA